MIMYMIHVIVKIQRLVVYILYINLFNSCVVQIYGS